MLRFATLLAILLLGPLPVRAQQTSPDRLTLPEQFRMRYFVHDRIVSTLPGYVGFDDEAPCYIVVHLLDTLAWGDSARALFRHALPADTSPVARAYCAGAPEVRLRAAQYTLAELMAFARRAEEVLREPELRVRGWVRVTPETLIVSAHNRAALARARARLAREAEIPQELLAYATSDREEVDGPVTPPRAAYLAVLDRIASAPRGQGRSIVIDARSLPQTVGEADLRARGLRPRSPSDSCNTDTVTVTSFKEARQFVNGTYQMHTFWQAYDYDYEVQCDAETCRIERAGQVDGDYVVTGCVSAEFGPNGLITWPSRQRRPHPDASPLLNRSPQ